jgi:hypothetical protein
MDMKFLVLPDQMWAIAVATLLVATAGLVGALAPMVLRRLAALMLARALRSANDNEEGFASPRSRLRCV